MSDALHWTTQKWEQLPSELLPKSCYSAVETAMPCLPVRSGTGAGDGIGGLNVALDIAVAGNDLVVILHAGLSGGILIAQGAGIGQQFPGGAAGCQTVNLVQLCVDHHIPVQNVAAGVGHDLGDGDVIQLGHAAGRNGCLGGGVGAASGGAVDGQHVVGSGLACRGIDVLIGQGTGTCDILEFYMLPHVQYSFPNISTCHLLLGLSLHV